MERYIGQVKYDVCIDKEPEEIYQAKQIEIINEMIRVLKPGGSLCYNHKDRIYNFQATSPLVWIFQTNAIFRQRITWNRLGYPITNPVRFGRTEEDIYILGKSVGKYKWNKSATAYKSIWEISPNKNLYGHPATFPEEIPKRCIEGFTNKGDVVLDPYSGIGTTIKVAKDMNRKYIGIDISEEYNKIAALRLSGDL